MQVKNIYGEFGQVEPFNSKKLEDHLKNPETEHVEVFDGTEENIKKRNLLANYKPGRSYKKAPRNRKSKRK